VPTDNNQRNELHILRDTKDILRFLFIESGNRMSYQAELGSSQDEKGRGHACVKEIVVSILDDTIRFLAAADANDERSRGSPLIIPRKRRKQLLQDFGIEGEDVSPWLMIETRRGESGTLGDGLDEFSGDLHFLE
jgi:hypothetical protein